MIPAERTLRARTGAEGTSPGGGRRAEQVIYMVVMRGALPPDLQHKIVKAHAEAIARRSASANGR